MSSPRSIKETLCDAFALYERDQSALLEVVDLILTAAMQTKELSFSPVADNRLVVVVVGSEPFNVTVPNDLSSFRSILARIGTICDSAAKKTSLVGKGRAALVRTGVIPDKTLTERGCGIEYVSASIREQLGSPLYRLDARLNIREAGHAEVSLQVEMQNELQTLSLVFRS
jgi:hypothetical protein